MKRDIFTNEEYEQIARYLSKEMAEEESGRFVKDFSGHPEKKKELESLEKEWGKFSGIEFSSQIDPDSAWENLHNKISGEQESRKTLHLPLWLKIAAGWLLLILVGTSVWMLTKESTTTDSLLTLNTYEENYTLVQTLHDGSVIYLGNNTSFSYPTFFESNQRNVQLSGEAFFDVAHNPLQPFIIETRGAVIEVLGTSFNIKTLDNENIELFVESGKVKLLSKKDNQKHLIAESGELLTLKNGIIYKETVSEQYNTAWRKHHMHFKDERLSNIINVLNQNYPVSFAIDSDELKDRKLTVTFYNTSVDDMAELISLTLNISYEKSNDSFIVFKTKV